MPFLYFSVRINLKTKPKLEHSSVQVILLVYVAWPWRHFCHWWPISV